MKALPIYELQLHSYSRRNPAPNPPRMEPTAYSTTNRGTWLGVSPFVGWHAWPATGGGSGTMRLPLGR